LDTGDSRFMKEKISQVPQFGSLRLGIYWYKMWGQREFENPSKLGDKAFFLRRWEA